MEVAFAPVTSYLLGDHCSIHGLHFSILGLRYWPLSLALSSRPGYQAVLTSHWSLRLPLPASLQPLTSPVSQVLSTLSSSEPVTAPELLDRQLPAINPLGCP